MKTLRMACAAAAGVLLSVVAASAQADNNPSIVSITGIGDNPPTPCASICVTLTVANPAAGTITLGVFGHVTSGGDDWINNPIGPDEAVAIVAGQTTYQVCFPDISGLVAGFNAERVQVVSTTVPGLVMGQASTNTKSNSFTCGGGYGSGTGGSGGGTGGSGGGSGGSGGTTGGTTQTAGSSSDSSSSSPTTSSGSFAATGGFDDRYALAGLALLLAGLALLLVSVRRRRLSQT